MSFTVPEHLLSECVIQAEFYHKCKVHGLNCALELSTPVGRLDAALFNPDWSVLIAIVEVKHNEACRVRRTPQIERYKTIGVPLFGLARSDRAEGLVLKIKETLLDSDGIPLHQLNEIPRLKWRRRRKHVFSGMDLCEEVNYRGP